MKDVSLVSKAQENLHNKFSECIESHFKIRKDVEGLKERMELTDDGSSSINEGKSFIPFLVIVNPLM